MSKSFSEFVCQQCGYKSPSFLGKCPECGEWNSLVETVLPQDSKGNLAKTNPAEILRLSEVKSQSTKRITSGFGEFDRVLGGGIVPGSIVLVSGDPGIGKSTLLLQSAMKIAAGSGTVRKLGESESRKTGKPETSDTSVLYVSGEESAQQIKIRADRIAKAPDNLYIFPETDVEVVIGACEKIAPKLVIVDSVQTLTTESLSGSAGSVGQVRECAQILQRYAKASQTPIFIVGHVTKEGNIAGPKVLEHLVDAVLNLEGDGMHTFRLLRSIKNRFGSTFEVGVFEMADSGMAEVSNPSGVFLEKRLGERPGSVVTSTLAGGRPILCEIQALVTPTVFAVPSRRATGIDLSRMQMLIAALGRAAKLNLGNLDVYVNVAGGLKIAEPAGDLAMVLSIASAVLEKPVGEKICAFGEVGLLGELREVGNLKIRSLEAKRLGFSDIVSAERFRTIEEAIKYTISQ